MNKIKKSFSDLNNSGYTIEIIETLEKLSEIKNDWDRLFNLRKQIPLFFSFELFEIYYESIIKNFKKVKMKIFVIRNNNQEIVAIFPFTCETKLFASNLSFKEFNLKDDYIISFYYFLIDTAENPEEIFQEFVHFLKKRMMKWDIIKVPSLPEDEYYFKLFISIINKSYKIDISQTNILVIDCKGEFDEYTKNIMDKKDLKELRKKSRRIKAQGKVTIVEMKDPQEIEKGLQYFYDIEDSGWKGDEGTSLKQLYIGEYYRRLAFHFSKENKFRLYFLKLNDEFIAGIYALIDHEILYLIKIGYSNDFHHYSPSMVLFYFLFEQLFEKKNIQKIDFYGTFQSYHKTFGKTTRKTYQITVCNQKVLSTIYFVILKVLKKLNYPFPDDSIKGKILISITKHF